MRAALYCRVSTRGQEVIGISLDEQRARLLAECARRGYDPAAVVQDAITGTGKKRRPNLERLLEQLDAGAYDVLMVTYLDRVSRSLLEFCVLLERANRGGWQLVMLEPSVDTTTPYGVAFAQMAGAFAQLQAALTAQKTREALAYVRAHGTRKGRPYDPGGAQRYADRHVVERIMGWKARGLGGNRIAERLELEGVRAPGGGRWHPKTVRRIIARELAGPTDGEQDS